MLTAMSGERTAGVEPAAQRPGLSALRARAKVLLKAGCRPDGVTHIVELAESGGYRLKFPNAQPLLTPTLINTGGGLLGGDRLDIALDLHANAAAAFATQSAERVYRALDDPAEIAVDLRLEDGARLDWLPCETILFSGARLKRSFSVTLAETAEFLAVEAMTFGRVGSDERLAEGLFTERWRLIRGGRLIYADDIRLDGDITRILAHKAVASGARAWATAIAAGPGVEARLEEARGLIEAEGIEAGASAWNNILVARFLASDPRPLRNCLVRFLMAWRGAPAPAHW
jgi:urease accessory protein